MTVVNPSKPHLKEREEQEFQKHYAHEREIYLGLISSSDSERTVEDNKMKHNLVVKGENVNELVKSVVDNQDG